MEDFNSYVKRGGTGEKTSQKNEGIDGQNFSGNQNLISLITSLAGKYNGKNENELLFAIMQEAEKSRRAGRLSDADIDNFATMLAPMLDANKRKKLYEVCNKLKKQK